jgi:hypothetical protein
LKIPFRKDTPPSAVPDQKRWPPAAGELPRLPFHLRKAIAVPGSIRMFFHG